MSAGSFARRLTLVAAMATATGIANAACSATLYLTFDTGNMRHAELIAATLARHRVKATFFVANEKTLRGDNALDPAWAPYWQARVAEGHAFGSHTWRHGSFRQDQGQLTRYRHVGWAPAGFLGDELPSETYPNALLVERALKNLKDGDIVMAHLGIWSRKDPFAPALDELLGGLEARGFCFATLATR